MEYSEFKNKWKADKVLEEVVLKEKSLRISVKMLYDEMVCVVEKIKIEGEKIEVLQRVVLDVKKIEDLKQILNNLYIIG